MLLGILLWCAGLLCVVGCFVVNHCDVFWVVVLCGLVLCCVELTVLLWLEKDLSENFYKEIMIYGSAVGHCSKLARLGQYSTGGQVRVELSRMISCILYPVSCNPYFVSCFLFPVSLFIVSCTANVLEGCQITINSPGYEIGRETGKG